jgi:probable phosphoglycerate mutase
MSVATTQLVLVRHGETEWSRLGKHTGRTDLPLTETGRDQARRLVARLGSPGRWARVLVSPLGRARETCALAGLGDRAEVTPDLAEWNYGAYEGLTSREIHEQQPGWNLWRDGCPGGESPQDVAARVDRVIAQARASNGAVIAFAHGHVLRALGARWVGLGPGDGGIFYLGTATVCELGSDDARPAVVLWNDGHHLFAPQ